MLRGSLSKKWTKFLVGAGSAGSVVAARLSEDADISVLLIEAGGTGWKVPYSHIPGFVAFNQKSSIDWQFRTEPQEKANFGQKNKVSFLWSTTKSSIPVDALCLLL